MAILYDWYENPGESDDSEEKGLHPRIFLNGKVGTDKLCRMIHGRSSLSVGDVKNAFEMLAQICGEELREGREVHIEHRLKSFLRFKQNRNSHASRIPEEWKIW